jgi:TPR repeat protein
MYDKGVRQDYVEAINWWMLAADQGLANAQCYLGAMYDKGTGVRQDFPNAFKWWKLATEQGYADAQSRYDVRRR